MADCPPGKKDWPELVGVDADVAAKIIEKENPNVKTEKILAGTPRIRNFSCARVWVDVNIKDMVVEIPRVG
ncbi:unnamed protein product [Amaranthus hypochondriacus]